MHPPRNILFPTSRHFVPLWRGQVGSPQRPITNPTVIAQNANTCPAPRTSTKQQPPQPPPKSSNYVQCAEQHVAFISGSIVNQKNIISNVLLFEIRLAAFPVAILAQGFSLELLCCHLGSGGLVPQA
eukprot:638239-Amphidinium_carterae.1